MQDIIEKLKSMDKKEIDSAVKKAKEFVATPEGQAFAQKIKNGEGAFPDGNRKGTAR